MGIGETGVIALRVGGGTSIDNVEWLRGIIISRERIRAKGLLLSGRFSIESCFLKRSPFVVFLVAFTDDAPLLALNARWLGLVALQSLLLACHTSCRGEGSVTIAMSPTGISSDKGILHTISALALLGFGDSTILNFSGRLCGGCGFWFRNSGFFGWNSDGGCDSGRLLQEDRR
jgi:hypothetical protein